MQKLKNNENRCLRDTVEQQIILSLRQCTKQIPVVSMIKTRVVNVLFRLKLKITYTAQPCGLLPLPASSGLLISPRRHKVKNVSRRHEGGGGGGWGESIGPFDTIHPIEKIFVTYNERSLYFQLIKNHLLLNWFP